MGFMRKALFLGTGGASGVVIRANSKKERTAKAAEKQLRIQRQMLKANERAATEAAAQAVSDAATCEVVLSAVKAVRASTGLGLREAKAVVDDLGVLRMPATADASALKASLEGLGATAEIRTLAEKTGPVESDAAVVDPPDAGIVGELARLADLHCDGSLDDAEFAAAKSKVLGH
jgi:ribosomal protein L7/L12